MSTRRQGIWQWPIITVGIVRVRKCQLEGKWSPRNWSLGLKSPRIQHLKSPRIQPSKATLLTVYGCASHGLPTTACISILSNYVSDNVHSHMNSRNIHNSAESQRKEVIAESHRGYEMRDRKQTKERRRKKKHPRLKNNYSVKSLLLILIVHWYHVWTFLSLKENPVFFFCLIEIWEWVCQECVDGESRRHWWNIDQFSVDIGFQRGLKTTKVTTTTKHISIVKSVIVPVVIALVIASVDARLHQVG